MSKLRSTARFSVDKGATTSTPMALRTMAWRSDDLHTRRFRTLLYRFLTDNIPAVSAAVSTWVRFSAAPGGFRVNAKSTQVAKRAEERLGNLSDRLYRTASGKQAGMVTLLVDLFTSLYRDGLYGGFLMVKPDGSGIDGFLSIDTADFAARGEGASFALRYERDDVSMDLNRTDFYFIPYGASVTEPFGRSILHSVPFVSYIEQQLVDDMRRTSHNSGFHRLHVKITPPAMMAGESDKAYIERINRYFDDTVAMIKNCDVDDNPVTWDNVAIEHVGPNASRSVTNSWFFAHRAMIEEICAGTNLAPFLLGYSYGATTTWSAFKFDMVMRQVRSIQTEVANFLEWIGNIDLALAGIDAKCRYEFDNTFAYLAEEKSRVQMTHVDSLLKLYQAGLVEEETARAKAEGLV
ncbi:MAG: hypothetical protein AAB305_07535 [Candidatus Zixiibacteriota bacterium]